MIDSRGSHHPSFNYTVHEPPQLRYDGPAPQTSNNIQQQWRQRPRSVQNNVPSPVTSVGSAVTAPSYQQPFDRSDFLPNNILPVNNRHDIDLLGMDFLAPSGHVVRGSYTPIARNYNDESWNPLNLRTSGVGNDTSPLSQSSASLKSYRHGPESICSPAPRSDSGFYSQSVVSHDASRMEQPTMQWNLPQQINNLNVRSTTSEAPALARVPSDRRSQFSHASSHSGYQAESLTCPLCGEKSKCRSDHKCVPCSMLHVNC
jgi:hypothetical protein